MFCLSCATTPPHFTYINKVNRAVVLNVFVHDFVSVKVCLNHIVFIVPCFGSDCKRLLGKNWKKETEYRLNDFVRRTSAAANEVRYHSFALNPSGV